LCHLRAGSQPLNVDCVRERMQRHTHHTRVLLTLRLASERTSIQFNRKHNSGRRRDVASSGRSVRFVPTSTKRQYRRFSVPAQQIPPKCSATLALHVGCLISPLMHCSVCALQRAEFAATVDACMSMCATSDSFSRLSDHCELGSSDERIHQRSGECTEWVPGVRTCALSARCVVDVRPSTAEDPIRSALRHDCSRRHDRTKQLGGHIGWSSRQLTQWSCCLPVWCVSD
jgi:hypothetical protein